MKRITVAKGDGIGPEIMDAVIQILEAADAKIQMDIVEIGEQVYKSGHSSGISKEAWQTIRKNKTATATKAISICSQTGMILILEYYKNSITLIDSISINYCCLI